MLEENSQLEGNRPSQLSRASYRTFSEAFLQEAEKNDTHLYLGPNSCFVDDLCSGRSSNLVKSSGLGWNSGITTD